MSLLGLRVERLDGQPLTGGVMFVRAILLVVDTLVSGLVGLVFMLATKRHQRVGDLAAGTVVVKA